MQDAHDAIDLPVEVVALIHHVELSQSGWWSRGLERMVLYVLDQPGSLDRQELARRVTDRFGIRAAPLVLEEPIRTMRDRGDIQELADGTLKISETCRQSIADDREAHTELEAKVARRFSEALSKESVPLDPATVWEDFQGEMLRPLIAELGAKTLQLVEGRRELVHRSSTISEFLERYDEDLRPLVRRTVLRFMDPQSVPVRRYVLYHLNAYFLVAAGSLDSDSLNALIEGTSKSVSMKVIVDTNFAFSVLGLHQNPSNEAAKALMKSASEAHSRVDIEFGVLPITLAEARRALEATTHELDRVRWTLGIARARLETGDVSGLAEAFVRHYVASQGKSSPHSFFQPYLESLGAILEQAGIKTFDIDTSPIQERASVRQEIRRLVEDQPDPRVKATEHDVVLWHVVEEMRPRAIESPLDAEYWVVTVDFGFVGFDERRKAGGMPSVLHPAQLLQLLEFWVPRSAALERAVLQAFRLPFMFYDYDREAEAVTHKILVTLSRFEAGTDLPERSIRGIMMNTALRQKIATEGNESTAVQLIENAAVEQLNVAGAVADELETRLVEAKEALEESSDTRRTLEEERDELQAKADKLVADNLRLQTAQEELSRALEDTRHEVEQLTAFRSEVEAESGRRARRRRHLLVLMALSTSLILLASLVVFVGFSFIDSRFWRVTLILVGSIAWFELAAWIVRLLGGPEHEEWQVSKWISWTRNWVGRTGGIGALMLNIIIEWSGNS